MDQDLQEDKLSDSDSEGDNSIDLEVKIFFYSEDFNSVIYYSNTIC